MDQNTGPVHPNIKNKGCLLPSLIESQGIVRSHIESFNYFVEKDMKRILEANQEVTIEAEPNFCVRFKSIEVERPTFLEKEVLDHPVTPHECRLRDLTYSGKIKVKIEYRSKIDAKAFTSASIVIGNLPVMLRSNLCMLTELEDEEEFAEHLECPLDPGGYFVIRGQEKVIIMQENLAKNHMMIDRDKDGHKVCQVTSATAKRINRTTVQHKKDQIYLVLHRLKESIPIFIVFKAMGILNEEQIVNMVGVTSQEQLMILETSIIKCHEIGIFTQSSALVYIGSRVKPTRHRKPTEMEGRDVVTMHMIPHIPAENHNFIAKAKYLALMVQRAIDNSNDDNIFDSKDFCGNKRIDTSGQLMSLLFEDLFKRLIESMVKDANDSFRKGGRNLDYNVHAKLQGFQPVMSKGFESAISSGLWKIDRFKMDRHGVTQPISRFSYVSSNGIVTRINSQTSKTMKISGARSVHYSQFGLVCPSDTPEGEQCGLVKNLALMSHVTVGSNVDELKNMAFILGVDSIFNKCLSEKESNSARMVFVNGCLIGSIQYYEEFMDKLKGIRRSDTREYLDPFVSISYESRCKAVKLNCDAGRLVRPYIIVTNGKSRLTNTHTDRLQRKIITFEYLVKNGIVEYLDTNELNDCLVAENESHITLDHTHLDIEIYTIFGYCASLIPYANYNQAPRITYQCAMSKQAMGCIGYNCQRRIDTISYELNYTQKPITDTKTGRMLHYGKLPAGQNATIAVLSYGGYDIEDAIILNKASLDRGFMQCTVNKMYKAALSSHKNNTSDCVQGPSLNSKTNKVLPQHECLERDGVCAVGKEVKGNQVLINHCSPADTENMSTQPLVKDDYLPNPVKLKHTLAKAVPDQVLVTTDKDHATLFKVKIREVRRPEIGDKFASRFGQKGVCGIILNQEDMPFSEQGIVPDVIMNPHGLPSRMTVGMLYEILCGKVGSGIGEIIDGTPFHATSHEVLSEMLSELGMECNGKDLFINGETGKYFEAYIFTGVVYYQKLKHMVIDKIHARAEGQIRDLTRQPTQGRAKDGGLKIGEMERDCLIAHGASLLLQERLMWSSDPFKVYVCRHCGLMGYKTMCEQCQTGENMANIKMPYACKLMLQEITSMNIIPRIRIGNRIK